MSVYVSADLIRQSAEQEEHSPANVFETLAEAVSRLFDRECEVDDDFFAPAPTAAASRELRAEGTRWVNLGAYIADSITSIDIDGTEYYTAVAADREYSEKSGYLYFDAEIEDNTLVTVTARFGFPSVPKLIEQACLEQAIALWRRKDMAFAEMAGVAAAAITSELTPTFSRTASRYRDMYSRRSFAL